MLQRWRLLAVQQKYAAEYTCVLALALNCEGDAAQPGIVMKQSSAGRCVHESCASNYLGACRSMGRSMVHIAPTLAVEPIFDVPKRSADRVETPNVDSAAKVGAGRTEQRPNPTAWTTPILDIPQRAAPPITRHRRMPSLEGLAGPPPPTATNRPYQASELP